MVINTQNVKDVSISAPPNFDDDINQVQTSQTTSTVTTNGSMKITDVQTRQRMDIFVTGVVGRSMGSGHFSVEDISDLTKNAVKSFDEFLKNK